MNKNTLIILVIGAVVIISGYLFLRGSSNNYSSNTVPQTETPAQNQNSIGRAVQQQNDNKLPPEETLADSSKQSSLIITYTDSGFSPSSLAIKNGQTVTFKNESTGDMWVASAPHPAHTDYPEFDAKKAYKNSESYSFTFTKVGTWKFHNHTKPSNFGSITVE